MTEGKRNYRPIEDYALIGDGLTGALVAKDGSIDWVCFPRFDSPSVFAAILDHAQGGSWVLRPDGEFTSTRRYWPDSAILETTFETPTGSAQVIDFMHVAEQTGRKPHGSSVVRIVRGIWGEVGFRTVVRPMFDYAREAASWVGVPGGGFRAEFREAMLGMQATVGLQSAQGELRTAFGVRAGHEEAFVLSYERAVGAAWTRDARSCADDCLAATTAWWRRWMTPFSYKGPYEEAVRRSAVTLKLLDYLPTGAIIAAATTSLPEELGGVRNWDYRYAWLRDTAFTLYAFYVIGHVDESEAFLRWVMEVAHGDPAHLQVLYGLEGETELTEYELKHLDGYEGSRPVRVGNLAHRQQQLDIFGEVIDCAYLYQRQGGTIGRDLWSFLRRMVDHVCDHWREPDRGIWEVRSEPQHFVYSKVLCWVAVERGVRIAEAQGHEADLDRWRREAAAIHAEVFERGYNEEIGAFTQAYGSTNLDAAALALPLRRFIAPDHPRMVSTVEAVVKSLSSNGLIRRYHRRADDGVPGGEGAFLLVSFWLVDCYAEMGRVTEARAFFERLLAFANDVGLYAEEVDPATGRHLGNFPQAFTHVALINAANSLGLAEQRLAAETASAAS